MSSLIPLCLEVRIIHVQSAITEKLYFSRPRLGELKYVMLQTYIYIYMILSVTDMHVFLELRIFPYKRVVAEEGLICITSG